MKVVFLQADKPREVNIADAFIAGLKRHGVNADRVVLKANNIDLPIDVDAVCMYGVKSRKLWDWYSKAGVQILYFDKGYIRRGPKAEYTRISVNAHQPTQKIIAAHFSDERFRRLGIELQPWRETGAHVVFAGSSDKYHAFSGLIEPTEYARRLIKRIVKWSAREVVYRPKPSWTGAVPIEGSRFSDGRRTIEDELVGAHALVTHGSNACFEAMVMGIPSVILGDAVARPISSVVLDEIANPRVATEGDRARLLANLAWFQWTQAEMAAGAAWEFLSTQLGRMPVDPLYAEMCRSLGRGHGQRGMDPEGTLNRLFRKTYGGPDDLPMLSDDNVDVTIEARAVADLQKLARPVTEDEAEPATLKFPVTVIHYRGAEYLIDGSKRVKAWSDKGRKTIEAYVVTVQ